MTWLPLLVSALGIVLATYTFWRIRHEAVEPGQARDIAAAIQKGALVFLRQEYLYLTLFIASVFVLVAVGINLPSALAFVFGAACSMAAGFIAMVTATSANVRTAIAAHRFGIAQAFSIAFSSGSVAGLVIASLGLMGVGFLY